jgi:hypothetical protein
MNNQFYRKDRDFHHPDVYGPSGPQFFPNNLDATQEGFVRHSEAMGLQCVPPHCALAKLAQTRLEMVTKKSIIHGQNKPQV